MKSIVRSEKGLLGVRVVLILAIIGALAIWAYHQGYFKWKGPKPAGVAQEAKSDLSDTLDKMKR